MSKIISKLYRDISFNRSIVLNTNLRRPTLHAHIDDEVRAFISRLDELMGAMDYAFEIMASQYPASDELCDQFDLLCSYIGSTWRTFFRQGATHKLHLLESHAPLQLRSFRVLGIFLEDPIERLHQSNNRQNRLFCNLKNYAK